MKHLRKDKRLLFRSLLVGVLLAIGGCDDSDEIPSSDGVDALDGDEVEDTPIFDWVEEFVSYGVRMPDSSGSIAAAEFVRDKFSEFGLRDVAIETVPTVVWEADSFSLNVDGEPVDAWYMQHSAVSETLGPDEESRELGTAEQGITAPIVYVGDGEEADFEEVDVSGKIVVANMQFSTYPRSFIEDLAPSLVPGFEFLVYDPRETFPEDFELTDPYSPNTYPGNMRRAIDEGAVGFIGILTDYIDSNEFHNEAYDGYDPGEELSIPGMWVTKDDGEALVDSLDAESEATMVLQAELYRATGRNTIGYLPGQSDEIIMIQSHHDSTTTGAVEDASGAALVLALARYFGRMPEAERGRTLLFTTMDTHFTDYASHKQFVENHIETEPIVANVTLEHVGLEVEDRPGEGVRVTDELVPRILMVSGEVDALDEISHDIVREHNLERTVVISTEAFRALGFGGLPADSSDFYRAGVPVLNLVGAPIYLYDSIDTLDKVPPEELERVATAFVDAVEQMMAKPEGAFEVEEEAQ
jgi:hypothetical protein